MRILVSLLLAPVLAACQGEGSFFVLDPNATSSSTSDTAATNIVTPGGGGACGEITHWAVTVTGRVETSDGSGAAFADVWVEDRGWNPTTITIGSTTADQQGNYTIQIADLVSAADCWGTVLDYVLVGQQGPIQGERQVNSPLFNAIQDGSLTANLAALTLQ